MPGRPAGLQAGGRDAARQTGRHTAEAAVAGPAGPGSTGTGRTAGGSGAGSAAGGRWAQEQAQVQAR